MGLRADSNNVERAGLPTTPSEVRTRHPKAKVANQPTICLIEDDPALREDGRDLFESAGWTVLDYFSAEAFLAAPRPVGDVCLVIDVMLPGMDGLSLLETIRAKGCTVPAIMLTGLGDAATAVAALKAGAADFIEKPAPRAALITSVADAMKAAKDVRDRTRLRDQAKARLNALSPRETDVLTMMLEGEPNKNIAADLAISQRTVEGHRARLMRKCGVKSLPALVQLVLLAKQTD
jgi:FixJ family two-component response regulator